MCRLCVNCFKVFIVVIYLLEIFFMCLASAAISHQYAHDFTSERDELARNEYILSPRNA